jgi:uncharacterized protein Veg
MPKVYKGDQKENHAEAKMEKAMNKYLEIKVGKSYKFRVEPEMKKKEQIKTGRVLSKTDKLFTVVLNTGLKESFTYSDIITERVKVGA